MCCIYSSQIMNKTWFLVKHVVSIPRIVMLLPEVSHTCVSRLCFECFLLYLLRNAGWSFCF